ncbi:queuosine precursor transporter [Methanococcoides orientis]|uniref:queuosine precursor transporter n=1 Tax=Methanococcoides orientis TaxID=2822137 RepID=UPI001E5FFACB|nr:queuosine precursor transporter [Methanococcoides orientis]UGV41321.1 queuosine precursor transporter [Methanococcoides orientis]
MYELILLIILTLAAATFVCYLGEKYGVGMCIGIFAGLVVTGQILATKVALFGPFVVPAGVIVHATTFLITDALCEFHGKKIAKQALWSGFLASILLVIAIQTAIALPSAPFWSGQEAFDLTLNSTGRIVFASLIAYIISQNWDVFIFDKIKTKTNGKHLWLRNCASTMSSQGLDTIIFITIGFYGLMPLVPLIIGQYIVKLLIATMDTPFLYAIKWAKEKKLMGLALNH